MYAPIPTVSAEKIGNTDVISRKDWGADETLRYRDHPIWVKALEKIATAPPPSEAVLKARERQRNMDTYLRDNFPATFETHEIIRKE